MKDGNLLIGLVGAGGMGKVHYANYQKIAGCRVAAVCGASKAEKEMAEKWNIRHAACTTMSLCIFWNVRERTFLHLM